MCGVRESFELIFMAIFASVAADVVFRLVQAKLGLADRRRLRGIVVGEPGDRGKNERTDQECFDESVQSSASPGFAIN